MTNTDHPPAWPTFLGMIVATLITIVIVILVQGLYYQSIQTMRTEKIENVRDLDRESFEREEQQATDNPTWSANYSRAKLSVDRGIEKYLEEKAK